MKKYKFCKTFTFEGKRYKVYADTEKELLRKFFERQKALEEGKVTVSGNMLVSKWAEIAIDSYKRNLNDKGKKEYALKS